MTATPDLRKPLPRQRRASTLVLLGRSVLPQPSRPTICIGRAFPGLVRTKSDKKPEIAALVPKRSDHLRLEEVEFVPGPGRGSR